MRLSAVECIPSCPRKWYSGGHDNTLFPSPVGVGGFRGRGSPVETSCEHATAILEPANRSQSHRIAPDRTQSKLIGAGGGGFLMFYTEEVTRLRRAMREKGLREVRIRFDFEGTKIVAQD